MATRMEGGAKFGNPDPATIEDAIANADPDEVDLCKKGYELWHTPY
jgi:hypothetical protein